MNMTRPLAAIVGRELKRLLRQRGRLLSSMARPLIWLLVIGGGFGSMLSQFGREGYQQFLVPGVLCMVLLFGALLSALSLVYDKESGVMRMLIVAPFSRTWIILARTFSGSLVGLAHALLLLAVLALLGFIHWPFNVGLLALGMIATALLSASLGMLIAVFSKTLENFAVIMNFFIFPVFFLSGALYPIDHLPQALRVITWVNPFSYGVDLLKHAFPPPEGNEVFATDFTVGLDVAMLALWIAVALMTACARFSRPRMMERFAARLSASRRS